MLFAWTSARCSRSQISGARGYVLCGFTEKEECGRRGRVAFTGVNPPDGWADAIGVPETDPREAARRPTALEAALPGGKRSVESGSGDSLDEGSTQGHGSRPPRTDATGNLKHECRQIRGSRGIALRLMRRVNVPRAPSLELYVLPNGGGQLLSRPSYTPTRQMASL